MPRLVYEFGRFNIGFEPIVYGALDKRYCREGMIGEYHVCYLKDRINK